MPPIYFTNRFKERIFDYLNPIGYEIKKGNLTYLSKGILYNIYKNVKILGKSQIPGIFIEPGRLGRECNYD